MERKHGPNFMQLAIHRVARDAIPDGGGLADGIRLYTDSEHRQALFREAFAWVDDVIAAVRAAPDNPYGDDEEEIAAAILCKIELSHARPADRSG